MSEPSPYQYVSTAALAAPPEAVDDDKFHVVALRKFFILNVFTLGFYTIYWAYRQWTAYKESQPFDSPAGSMWPAMRSIFLVFFLPSLYRKVKEAGAGNPEFDDWSAGGESALAVILMLMRYGFDKAAERLDSGLFAAISMGLLVLLTAVLCGFQRRINLVCGDPEGARNARFTKANWAWMIGFSILLFFAIIGYVAG
jgi:hypothetical protein